ncbi:MAG: tetratricopeptide repeat protein, partial [Flavisolibacter sp.]|nr:tetratricopeptide repeat protein [Flavisolibacter sp.]
VLDDASETYNALNKTYDSVLNNVIYPLQGQERLATNLYIYLHYIRLLIFPFPLSIDYSFSQITPKTFGNGWVLLSFFFFLFLIIGAFKNLSKRTVIGFGILYYLITFSIFSNFFESITIGATIGERFMFLPSLGFCIVLVYGLYLLAKRINSTRITPIVLAVLIPVSLVYSIKSFSRTKVWSDNIALYKSGLKTAPQSWRIHYNLAEVSLTQAQNLSADSSARKLKADSIKYWYQLAKKEYESAYKIIEGQTSIPFLLHLHYGDVLLPLEDTAGAKRAYQEAATSSPDLSSAWSNLGTVAYHQKDFVSAINYYRKALQAAAPDSFFLYASLGSSYMNLKDYPSAIQFFEKALQHGSDKRIATDLANLYATVGNQKKAGAPETTNTSVPDEQQYFRGLINAGMNAFNQADYRKAIKYFSQCEPFYYKNGGIAAFPDFLNVWAQSYLNVNDIGNAKATFSKVLREDPKNFIALHNLGFIAYQREKNYKQATEYLQRCLKANSPNYYSVYTGLGYLYSIQSMPDKAIESYESALKYGSSQDILNNLYQLWKSKGNQEKMDYYQALLTKK